MIRASSKGDWKAGLELLKHRFPHEYSEKRVLEHRVTELPELKVIYKLPDGKTMEDYRPKPEDPE